MTSPPRSRTPRPARRLLALLCGAGLLAVRPAAADDGGAQATATFSDSTHLAQARRVSERALAFLAAHMRTNGSFERVGGSYFPQIAATALSALAFMANGHTADEGGDRYAPQLRLQLDWLMTQVQVKPCLCTAIAGPHDVATFVDPSFNGSQTHGHGYAMWALAMASGMSFGSDNALQRTRLRTILQGAVHAAEVSQSTQGGWMYTFDDTKDHEGSVTVTLLQGLRAAKESGIRVSAATIDRAVDYLRKSQVLDGNSPSLGAFRYRLGDEKVTFALTAAAVSSLNQTGDYDSKYVERGLAYMRLKDPVTTLTAETNRWPWYERLYVAQAYFQYRDLRYFRQWYPPMVEQSAQSQQKDGSFSDSEFGDIYATATAALTLAVPFGYLPSFQR